jgi:hypothetical protein
MQSTSRDTFYVVTRNGRRIESKNYLDFDQAKSRAEKLISMVQSWDANSINKVTIVKTSKPFNIR